ncbi:Sarcoglycan complex subunit protein [Nesidiocoris tenuis]|uniref:Beta-sarcoglycan n=1 Tax=Nesidiocoris tenuis TaxID=355587 RepID=A0ABN7B748_9HEMI|nr:Sarcoglycan complex subunit protein [Nesidiocoris tenuis]
MAARQRSQMRSWDEYDDCSKGGGPKTYAFWTLVGLLCLLAWANMILTVAIFSVLRLGQGMESLELLPDQGVVKFFGDADLGNIYKPNGKIEGVRGYSTQLRGVKGGVHLEVEDSRGRVRNSLTLEQNGTHVKGMRSFTVGGFFAAEKPDFRLLSGARNLHGRHIETGRVAGPLGEKAVYRSDAFTKLKGSEGTRIEGKEILLTADQEVRLKSVNGSIILTGGKGGISLDVKSIPIVTKSLGGYLASQYKVCVCMPQGKLFRVPVSKDYNSQMGCYNIDVSPQHNPCM